MKRRGLPLDGFLALDKPLGLTSTQALGRARRALGAAKAGHCGTLDPLATGVLVLAFGEATKLVDHVMDGAKRYRFGVRWGEARNTDDAEGAVVATSDHRPDRAAIEAALPRFLGTIDQVPPAFSAIKRDGQPAYARARAGEAVEMASRRVRIDRVALVEMPGRGRAVFEVDCGKGTYVRSLGRDLAQVLGTVGFIDELRRLKVGPFTIEKAFSLASLEAPGYTRAAFLQPVETALDDIPAVAVTGAQAEALRQGRAVQLPRAAPALSAMPPGRTIAVLADDRLIAMARVDADQIRPLRVLNRQA
ncbi:MAG: tRNA pseudouridine(55) synthase TruB [Alphaproteobacteria bacterium]|nr:tRNA pseudouridine(55) synthase TruB [Alphaproteobacteria bacterium]